MLLFGGTLMAAEGGGRSDGGSRRRPYAAARLRAFLFIAVIPALVRPADARYFAVPHFDHSASWTFDVGGNVDWRPAALVAAASTGDGRRVTELPWRRPLNTVYSRHRRRTESDRYRRFSADSTWKRRSMYLTSE